MANDPRREPVQKKKPPGWFGWTLGLPFRILGVILISILTSIIAEWCGIYFGWWSQPGAAHARATLASELGWIDTQFTRSVLATQPVEIAHQVLDTVYQTLFVDSGIAAGSNAWAGQGQGITATIGVYLQAAIDVSLVVLVRIIILTLTSPLFVMAAAVGVIDGLVRRDLRRFGAGRESSFIYHHAKRLTGPVFILGWLIYLSLPFSVYPDAFLLPCAALFGVLVSITVGSFKKYL